MRFKDNLGIVFAVLIYYLSLTHKVSRHRIEDKLLEK